MGRCSGHGRKVSMALWGGVESTVRGVVGT